MNRCQLLRALELEREWDVIVVGGGAIRLGVAVDAATRGLRTVLLEANDFAKGTSSRSTTSFTAAFVTLSRAIFRWSWKPCGKGACSIGTRLTLSITSPLLFLATNGGGTIFRNRVEGLRRIGRLNLAASKVLSREETPPESRISSRKTSSEE